MSLKVLELFSGSGILSETFREFGHETRTLDFNSKYNPDICCDILEFNIDMLNGFIPDVIHASPECRCFSVASMGHHWTGGTKAYIPKTEDAKIAIQILDKLLNIIKELNPKVVYIENPRGVMRKMPQMIEFANNNHFHTITYCQYGDTRMKPTDIWTNNPLWIPKPMCKNGALCHERAPRGSKTGTQGLSNSFFRSKMPKKLCIELVKSTEEVFKTT